MPVSGLLGRQLLLPRRMKGPRLGLPSSPRFLQLTGQAPALLIQPPLQRLELALEGGGAGLGGRRLLLLGAQVTLGRIGPGLDPLQLRRQLLMPGFLLNHRGMRARWKGEEDRLHPSNLGKPTSLALASAAAASCLALPASIAASLALASRAAAMV